MPWTSTSVSDQRIKFVVRASQDSANMSALCREFGVSRPTGYLWLDRYREHGSLSGVFERSRRPLRSPSRTQQSHEERIEALRLEFGWGAKKIRVLLLREGLDLKVATINRILKRRGLIHHKDSHRPAVKRFEREHPNQLWQIDFKGDYPSDGGRCYPLSVIDDHSRYGIGLYALSGQGTKTVSDSLVKAFESCGVPHAMLMDHGIPWWSTSNNNGLTRLSVSLIDLGIKLYYSGIRHPQTQGKVERFHRTLNESIRHRGRPKTSSGWEQTLKSFLYEYNHIRPHEALQMATPSEYYQPSQKVFDPTPKKWEYPRGSVVETLNTRGWLGKSRTRYFVSEALAGKQVRIEKIETKLIVSYRHMYIREIDTETGRTKSLITPVSAT
ncbi:MAG: IS481 family transposase [Deltaproteobacteria bacterium]|nr:IS481 family transposase [Deltaproteobacteria bacterium]